MPQIKLLSFQGCYLFIRVFLFLGIGLTLLCKLTKVSLEYETPYDV